MRRHITFILFVLAAGIGFLPTAFAITPQALQHEIEANGKLTIIDIRPNAVYRKSHIHNAINIPANLVPLKRLPPLGRVVVYNDGIDLEMLEQAVTALNAKPGIRAVALQGGFSAWSAQLNVVQRDTGLATSRVKTVTYQMLQKMAQSSKPLVLIDLRAGAEQEALADHFPGVQLYDPIHTVREDVSDMAVGSEILNGIPKRNRDVLILIDDGNGLAQRVADKLHAAGTRRLAILIGGERSLRVRGESTEAVRSSGE